MFGSQARGATTGFSDVDAILVIRDDAAEEPNALRALRPHVLAAQRAVFAHQPMQHHGFELATPRLLLRANDALGMPAPALTDTRSLLGGAIEVGFAPEDPLENRVVLGRMVQITSSVSAWPRHAWSLHRLISMFELLPTLYLQALGEPVQKWRSFAQTREHFGQAWWPYDLLDRVRNNWERKSAPTLNTAATVVRNPWVALRGWTRLPTSGAQPARGVLSIECLQGLRSLAREMGERAC
jgi:hypothetical protein